MNLSLLPVIILFSIPFIFVYGDHMGRLALELEDSPDSGTFTEVWFQERNQGNQWDQFTVDLSTEDNTGQRQLRFVASGANGVRSDMAVDEIRIQGVATPPIISFEDFEAGFTTWTNTSGDDNDCWTKDSAETPTTNTGPSTGAAGTDWYVYYEASFACAAAGDTSYLLGPTIDFNSFNEIEITFSRHMWNGIGGRIVPDLEFMVYKGIQYYDLGNYNKAISIFQNVLKKDKNNFPALVNLGHVYYSLEQYTNAINYYERALSIEPNDNLSLYRFQIALLERASYQYGFLDGVLEIKVHDSKGGLVAYLQSSQITSLEHTISEKIIDSWPVSKTVYRNDQEYSVHQKEFVKIIENDTLLGFHEIPFNYNMDLPLASTWHYQIPSEKGDVITYAYSFYRPVI